MNYKMIANLIGRILCVEAVFLLPSAGISLYFREYDTIFPILISVLLMAVIGILLMKPKYKADYYPREGFIAVALAWIVISVFGALPFYISGEIPSFLDSVFETISGFTTTGATILKDVEALSKGLLYWRSFTHWLGGMGVLVFVLAIHPTAKGSGQSLYLLRAESPGPEVDKLVPKTGTSAKILYGLYIGMSALQFLLLALGGLPWFDNLTTVFGTAGTGGFGIYGDSIASYSSYEQTIITIFMTLFGVNFTVYYLLITGKPKQALRNEELRLYLLIQVVAAGLITADTYHLYPNLRQAMHHAAFQVSSIMTTTGFATVNFDVWPEFSKWILVLLMFVGASAGSTGGGIKVSRILLMIKSALCERRRQLSPRKVSVVRMDGKLVSDDTLRGIWQYMAFYLIITGISVLVLSLENLGFDTTLASVAACLNNIGPGLSASGPIGSFADFSDLSKVVLCADMLLGRLEIIPFMMLFAPSNWGKH